MSTETKVASHDHAEEDQTPMPSQFETNERYEITNVARPMTNPPASFLVQEPPASAPNDIIVRTDDGLDIEGSLRNVSNLASTWYKSSTRQLYAVLGQCYELYYLVETAEKEQRDRYKDDIKAAYDNLNGAQGANSPLSRIVSVVFNFADLDRRQRSRYSSVIRCAYNSEPKPTSASTFVAWLERIGGIVAALEKRSTSTGTKIEQSAINEHVRKLPAIARLSIPSSGNRFVVMLASPVDSNTVEVLYTFEEDSIGDRLATKAYNAQKKLAKETSQRETAASVADELAAKQPPEEGA